MCIRGVVWALARTQPSDWCFRVHINTFSHVIHPHKLRYVICKHGHAHSVMLLELCVHSQALGNVMYEKRCVSVSLTTLRLCVSMCSWRHNVHMSLTTLYVCLTSLDLFLTSLHLNTPNITVSVPVCTQHHCIYMFLTSLNSRIPNDTVPHSTTCLCP